MTVAAAIALFERAGAERTVQRGVPVGWRNVRSQPQRTEFTDGTVVEWWSHHPSVVQVRVASLETTGASL